MALYAASAAANWSAAFEPAPPELGAVGVVVGAAGAAVALAGAAVEPEPGVAAGLGAAGAAGFAAGAAAGGVGSFGSSAI